MALTRCLADRLALNPLPMQPNYNKHFCRIHPTILVRKALSAYCTRSPLTETRKDALEEQKRGEG